MRYALLGPLTVRRGTVLPLIILGATFIVAVGAHLWLYRESDLRRRKRFRQARNWILVGLLAQVVIALFVEYAVQSWTNPSRDIAPQAANSPHAASPRSSSFATSPSLHPVLDSSRLIRVANVDEAELWRKGTRAMPGQTLVFYVHVMNLVFVTSANDVRVQVYLPSTTDGRVHVAGTVVGGNASAIVAGVSVTIPEGSHLEYVPGSTVLVDHYHKKTPLPDGIVESGLNLGDFHGSWENEKWVMFGAKVIRRSDVGPGVGEAVE